jgi:hypothetical protein
VPYSEEDIEKYSQDGLFKSLYQQVGRGVTAIKIEWHDTETDGVWNGLSRSNQAEVGTDKIPAYVL